MESWAVSFAAMDCRIPIRLKYGNERLASGALATIGVRYTSQEVLPV
jgi:hypothetical protein